MSQSRRLGIKIFLALVIFALLLSAVGYHYTRAQNAFTAMAKGQYWRAHNFYRDAAVEGDPIAQNALGNLYYVGLGVRKNYAEALKWYRQSARAGNANALLNIGHLHGQGFGVAQDPVKAFAWYNMANKYGNPIAEYYLTQISVEWTLTPLMIESARRKYAKLSSLISD